MADFIMPVLELALECYKTYHAFHDMKGVCCRFRALLHVAASLLQDIMDALKKSPNKYRRTNFRPSLELLESAIKLGKEVLEHCSKKDGVRNQIRLRVFSREHADKIERASRDIDMAVSSLSTACTSIHIETSDAAEETKKHVEMLSKQLEQIDHTIYDAINQGIGQNFIARFDQLEARLKDLGVIDNSEDLYAQIEDLQTDNEDMKEAKTRQYSQLYQAILRLSMHETKGSVEGEILGANSGETEATISSSSTSESTLDLEGILTCPITLDIMRDPWMVTASGTTYEHEAICKSLLMYLDLDPFTNIRYDQPLEIAPNVGLRSVLMQKYGDDAYQKYDAGNFEEAYIEAWVAKRGGSANMDNPPSSSNDHPAAQLLDDGSIQSGDDSIDSDNHESPSYLGHILSSPGEPSSGPVNISPANADVAELVTDFPSILGDFAPNDWNMPQDFPDQPYDEAISSNLTVGHARKTPLVEILMAVDPDDSANPASHIEDLAKIDERIGIHIEDLVKTDERVGSFVEYTDTDEQRAEKFYKAGRDHLSGKNGANPNESEALSLLTKAAELNHVEAQVALGQVFLDKKDDRMAFSWFSKAAKQGDAPAQYHLSILYRQGRGTIQSRELAAEWCQKAAKQDLVEAQMKLSELYESGEGVEQDEALAAEWMSKAAKQGHPKAQLKLCTFYQNGFGVPNSDVLAFLWCELSAFEGDIEAQNKLGTFYYFGYGVEKDYRSAVKWYRKAAVMGHSKSQYALGTMYDEGKGVVPDKKIAVEWYRKAAEHGSPSAQRNLGVKYESGVGVNQDYKMAAFWYKKAADKGHAQSQFYLGLMYEKGLGVGKNCNIAAQWYRKAEEKGNELASRRLMTMPSNLKVRTKRNSLQF